MQAGNNTLKILKKKDLNCICFECIRCTSYSKAANTLLRPTIYITSAKKNTLSISMCGFPLDVWVGVVQVR